LLSRSDRDLIDDLALSQTLAAAYCHSLDRGQAALEPYRDTKKLIDENKENGTCCLQQATMEVTGIRLEDA
jgi:hypothetical protein